MPKKENDITKIKFGDRTKMSGEKYVHVNVEDRKGRMESLDAPDRATGRTLGIRQMESRQERDEKKTKDEKKNKG